MTRWFEDVKNDPSNIVSSRVRLSRNWEEYKFPSRLEDNEARYMVGRMMQELRDIQGKDGRRYEFRALEKMEELDRVALRERRLLNKTLVEKKTPGSIICSDDEAVSLVLNGDDHIRLQILAPGLELKSCYDEADKLDDYLNAKFPYAFSSKYGRPESFCRRICLSWQRKEMEPLPRFFT